MPPPSTPASQIEYIVFAHSDDEYASWSLIENSPANYKVFVNCTRGEQASGCANPAVDPGEDAPNPRPSAKESIECETARINSFRSFLVYMSSIDPYISDTGGADGTGPLPNGKGYIVAAGRYCAALFCDYDDNRAPPLTPITPLTPTRVGYCIQAARNERGNRIPSLPEYAVIGVWPGPHPDHDAIRNHVANKDYGFYRLVTDPHDTFGNRRTDETELATHSHAFKANPRLGNIGAFQRAYGWLTAGYWQPNLYSRTQYHAQFDR